MRTHLTSQSHLEIRSTGFHWRRRWPRRWLATPGWTSENKSSLLFSLRTQILPDAKVLAQKLTFLTDIAFARRLEMTMAIGPDMMARLLGELGCFLVEAHELAREIAPQLTPEAVVFEASSSQAAIDALRQALSRRDRVPAYQPLRDVATRLGVLIDEGDEDWSRLAFRALRVMLDAAQENARRDSGIYDAPSPFFHSSRAANVGTIAAVTPTSALPTVTPAASSAPAQTTSVIPDPVDAIPAPPTNPEPTPSVPHDVDPEKVDEVIHSPPSVVPEAKETAVNDLLLEEYFDLYIAKKIEGYTDDFGEEEVPDAAVGEKWRKSSKNNMEVGKRLWVALLGNRPLDKITDAEIREAKKKLRKIPESHAKSCSETRDLDALIAETDAEETRKIEHAVAEATLSEGSPAKIERAKLDNLIPRIRVETILKHTRSLNRSAKMLVKMGELETSPFQKHMISNRTADAMRRTEEKRDRRPWDDRIYDFLSTMVFRGGFNEVGDPMFGPRSIPDTPCPKGAGRRSRNPSAGPRPWAAWPRRSTAASTGSALNSR